MENQEIICINREERVVAISQKKPTSVKQFKADRTIFLNQNDGRTAKTFAQKLLLVLSDTKCGTV